MAGYANMNPEDLRFLLAALARAHQQKLQLVLFTNLPLVGVEAPAKPVFEKMNAAQGELEKELTTWAKKRNVDLTFQFPSDVPSQAQKLMEGRQEKVMLSDGKVDRTRDAVINMYIDYEFQICVVEALLPKVTDPELRRYLEHSLKVHEEGSKELREVLKRYKLS
jgi:predicted outer membrane protein